jgi:uncharacterized protein
MLPDTERERASRAGFAALAPPVGEEESVLKSKAQEPVGEARAMVAEMGPVLEPGEVVFCTTADEALATEEARASALGLFRESEGVSLILPRGEAERLGLPVDMPMRRIVLTVASALNGVGLTAAVSGALAAEGIPCNVVAAFHHDHVFVPSGAAERALAVLKAAQAGAVRDGQP